MDENSFVNAIQSFDQIEFDSKLNLSELEIIDFLTEATGSLIYQSKSETRRALDQNAVSINKAKVSKDYKLGDLDLLHNKFIIVSKGKKKHFIVKKKD